MHGEAVAVDLFFDGVSVVWLVWAELDELELLELELLELAGTRHGGTISVVMLELAGTTSWFCGCAPAAACAPGPPGVTRIVLAAGGVTAPVELLLLLLELDELELEEGGGWQACTATVWVTLLVGIWTLFDPGGGEVAPAEVAAASEHDGTMIVSGPCCLGIWIVRVPGVISAVETGSALLEELEELLLLPPQAARPPTSAIPVISPPTTRVAAPLTLVIILPPPGARPGSGRLSAAPCAAREASALALPR